MDTSLSTTENRLYIIETDPPFERLAIQFMPETIEWERRGDLATVAVVGRNNPHYQLTGGEDEISFRLDLYAEEVSREDVIRRVRWLQSLLYNDGNRRGVRNVRIVWGDLFHNEVWVVKRARAALSHFHSKAGMLPQQAYVELSFGLDPTRNLSLRDVRR